jgi:hypothetical protein
LIFYHLMQEANGLAGPGATLFGIRRVVPLEPLLVDKRSEFGLNDVCYWHLAVIRERPVDVRFRGKADMTPPDLLAQSGTILCPFAGAASEAARVHHICQRSIGVARLLRAHNEANANGL